MGINLEQYWPGHHRHQFPRKLREAAHGCCRQSFLTARGLHDHNDSHDRSRCRWASLIATTAREILYYSVNPTRTAMTEGYEGATSTGLQLFAH